jgi:hypothetical protein
MADAAALHCLMSRPGVRVSTLGPSRLGVAMLLGLLGCRTSGRSSPLPENAGAIVSGTEWLDTSGERIEAHGGGMLQVGARYYWYGENHRLGFGNKTGISAYSSADLVHWTNEGVVLPKDSLPPRFRDAGVAERPKVIFNSRTKQYSADEAQVQERARGNTFRDMALFRDDDSRAYVHYASESNKTLYVVRLDESYTDIVRPAVQGTTWARVLVGQRREAPAPFKVGARYYMITSAQTGWAPNPARYHVADDILGPWRTLGNPAVGADSATTFRSQSAFVLPLPMVCGRCLVFMGDRWESRALQRSTYVWLPFVVGADGSVKIEMMPRWSLRTLRELGAAR